MCCKAYNISSQLKVFILPYFKGFVLENSPMQAIFNSFFRFVVSQLVLLLVAIELAIAQDNQKEIVEEIKIYAEDLRYEIKFDRLQSANILGVEAIQKIQSADVFDVLSGMPGVDIQGGITTGGKSFSIRGFGDNEDVLVQIDGVTQNFEKYRAGTGVEIEPELLKEIAVFRGGTSVAQGAGYLGGVVQMETKDARDFLKDERIGGVIRWGWKDNNDEKFASQTLYALPFDGIDILINNVSRKTNDLTQPNGEPFDYSDEQQVSYLAKIERYTINSILSYSFRSSKDEGVEPFDLVSNCNNASNTATLCRDMFRDTKEKAHSFRGQYTPANPFIDFDFVVGYIHKSVMEQNQVAGGFVEVGNSEDPIGRFQYDIWNVSLKNVSEFDSDLMGSRWTYGVQATREKRISTQERNGVLEEYASQPSGLKATKAIYADVVFELAPWRLQAGIRHDRYAVYSKDKQVVSFTQSRFGNKKIRFSQSTPSFSIDFDVGDSTVFYQYSKAFRAPLVTQYFGPSSNFSISAAGSCAGFNEVIVQPARAEFPSGFAGILEYNAAIQNYINNVPEYLKYSNYFCGDVYRPERSITKEVGLLTDWAEILQHNIETKLTYFEIDRSYKLNSLYQDSDTLLISQPNKDSRSGVEAEFIYANANGWIASVNYSSLKGRRIDSVNGVYSSSGLRAPPGDAINVHIAKTLKNIDSRIGLTIRAVKSRQVDQNTDIRLSVADAQYLRVPGYGVFNFYSSLKANDQWSFRFSINNLFNKEYQLRGFGGGIGNVSAGRDLRVAMSYEL